MGGQSQETCCLVLSLPLLPCFVVENILVLESDTLDCGASLYHLLGLQPDLFYILFKKQQHPYESGKLSQPKTGHL